jgi:phage terminase large subunit
VTQDPRLPEKGAIPFVLFKRQIELIDFIMARWRAGECGVVVRSRDIGMSWIIAALSVTLCLFHPGMLITIYSRKEDLVDHLGDPGSLFEKCRFFASHLPAEFTGGWRRDVHSAHLRILFPISGGAILGESGDQAGRGARSSLTFCDEFAFTEHPAMVDASLAAVTPTRIYCSTPNGRGNLFAERYFGGKIPTFNLGWRGDSRKDQSWYDRQARELDSITLASEVDADFGLAPSAC